MSNKNIKRVFEKYNLPREIQVAVNKTKEGTFIASFPDLPGCLTEAENVIGLIYKVNDALYTYFGVKRKDLEGVEILFMPPQKFLLDMKKIEVVDDELKVIKRNKMEFTTPYTACFA